MVSYTFLFTSSFGALGLWVVVITITSRNATFFYSPVGGMDITVVHQKNLCSPTIRHRNFI